MKNGLKILCALMTFLIGIAASSLWLRLWSAPSGPAFDDRIPPGNITGKITLRFIECAGDQAVFLLDNGTDHRIFTRIQRVDFWEGFKEADLQYGVHLVHHTPPGAHDYDDVGPVFDGLPPFQVIMPHETIRYGINLWRGPGEYRVMVPYMEDAEVFRKLEEDFPNFLKDDFERVKAAWKTVSSDVGTGTCH